MKKKSRNELVDIEKKIRKRQSRVRKFMVFGFPLFFILGSLIALRIMYLNVRPSIDVLPGPLRGGMITVLAPSLTPSERLSDLDFLGGEYEMMVQYVYPEEDDAEEEVQDLRTVEYTKLEEIISRRLLDREYSSVVTYSTDDLFPEYFENVDAFADAPDEQLVEYCHLFWGRYIAQILNKYQLDKGNENGGKWLAWANGAYAWALWDYARLTQENDMSKIEAELNASITTCAVDFLKSYDGDFSETIISDDYFPVFKGVSFRALRAQEATAPWWSKFIKTSAKERDALAALYLPAQAQFSLPEGDENAFSIHFAFVPLNLGTGENESILSEYVNSQLLSPLYLAVGEVTAEQLNVFRTQNGRESSSSGGSMPCVDCSVEEAVEFCNWLSERDGLKPLYKRTDDGWEVNITQVGYRLPFAYEWEYAARFGCDFFERSGFLSWEEIQARLEQNGDFVGDELVNYYWKDSPRTLSENKYSYPLGMFDLCGNASEIVMLTDEPVSQERTNVPVTFSAMKGGVDGTGARLATMAPWLLKGNERSLRAIDNSLDDKNGFRVVRSVPIRSLYK